MHWLFVLSLYMLPGSTALLGQHNLEFSPRIFCGTGAPSEVLRAEHKRLSSVDVRRVKDDESGETSSQIQIDTWFHIVSSNDKVDLVTDNMIMSQVSIDHLTQLLLEESVTCSKIGT